MRNDTRARLFASLAVLAVSSAPIAAYGATVTDDAAQAAPKADAKKDEIASWPEEKQASYNAWPDATKSYYWTLSADRQKLFWSLTDPDKVALSGMSKPDQDKAWARIEGRGGSRS
ncbi:MAG: hypothetical protein QNI87_05675 [Erythrobacter sp.]|uniref:hypothetical protein n=1 Tax=Erythrobacter sp. TaxID=1042 RepID=UPI002635F197|nr:hypothetical protein [Erythrobacter sp.]MDJ0978007.1 hypothetical protein [Erythrobacter sp.]